MQKETPQIRKKKNCKTQEVMVHLNIFGNPNKERSNYLTPFPCLESRHPRFLNSMVGLAPEQKPNKNQTKQLR